MEKTKISVAILLGFVVLGLAVFFAPNEVRKSLGIAVTEVNYASSSITQGSVTCNSYLATTTAVQVVSTQTGRTSFIATNNSFPIGGIYLCKSGTSCTATSGIPIVNSRTASSGLPFWEQKDGYVGPYSCIGDVTSTLGYQYSL